MPCMFLKVHSRSGAALGPCGRSSSPDRRVVQHALLSLLLCDTCHFIEERRDRGHLTRFGHESKTSDFLQRDCRAVGNQEIRQQVGRSKNVARSTSPLSPADKTTCECERRLLPTYNGHMPLTRSPRSKTSTRHIAEHNRGRRTRREHDLRGNDSSECKWKVGRPVNDGKRNAKPRSPSAQGLCDLGSRAQACIVWLVVERVPLYVERTPSSTEAPIQMNMPGRTLGQTSDAMNLATRAFLNILHLRVSPELGTQRTRYKGETRLLASDEKAR